MNDEQGPAAQAAAWIAENWDRDLTVQEWWARASAAGWLFPAWPVGLGGHELDAQATRDVYEKFVAASALGPPFGVGQTHSAPLLLAKGTPAQQQRLVPALAEGRESWCQLFSEPGSGSDLSSIRTRAERAADGGWRITGQKIWTSGARESTRAILLVRTDWEVPKHKGLTMMILDLDQPGVDIRPIIQMNGSAGSFNEVFLDGVTVPDADVIGEPGEGWACAQIVLAFERAAMNARVPGLVYAPPGDGHGALTRTVGAVIDDGGETPYVRDRKWINARKLALLARDRGTFDAAVERQLVDMACLERSVELLDARVNSTGKSSSEVGVSPSVIKLARSTLARAASEIAADVLGDEGLLVGEDAPDGGTLSKLVLSTPSYSIAGGTDEIQKNIIAERHFGLPREDDPSRTVAFGAVRAGTQQ